MKAVVLDNLDYDDPVEEALKVFGDACNGELPLRWRCSRMHKGGLLLVVPEPVATRVVQRATQLGEEEERKGRKAPMRAHIALNAREKKDETRRV